MEHLTFDLGCLLSKETLSIGNLQSNYAFCGSPKLLFSLLMFCFCAARQQRGVLGSQPHAYSNTAVEGCAVLYML